MLVRDDCAVFRTSDRAITLIAKLPHVPGPITHHQQVHRLRRDLNILATKLRRIMIDVIVDDRRNLRTALAQWRHTQPNHVEPVRFPLVTALCREANLDLATDPIPVSPAAHYLMGGVTTDLDARTTIPGLFAAGETACTGVHGANRLASNSLLE